ncbi:CPBP family intramembrane metalloprotease [Nitriliruptoraceae bacterium ZYF776]|nr:CPBP family intramembrane metalloprotease [Profundirhabdus halotolerans]
MAYGRGVLLVVVLATALTAWSVVGNLVVGERCYTRRNVALTLVLLAVAWAAGLDAVDLGLAVPALAGGLRWGAAGAAVVLAGLAVAVVASFRVPAVARLLDDRRGDLPPRELVRHSLIRIPLGTAMFEEVAFRGVLLAALLAVTAPPTAAVVSSVVFGLWHVAPTAVALRVNGVDPRSAAGVRAVLAGVVVTTVGGFVFAWLRLGAASLLAPVLVHVATNVGSLLAAAVRRRARPRSRGSRG